MARLWPKNAKTAVLTKLQSDLESTLNNINTDAQSPTRIHGGYLTGQTGEVVVMVAPETTLEANPENSVDIVTEYLQIVITAYLRSNQPDIEDWVEDYIRAIQEVVQGMFIQDATRVHTTQTFRDYMGDTRPESKINIIKIGGVVLDIQSN